MSHTGQTAIAAQAAWVYGAWSDNDTITIMLTVDAINALIETLPESDTVQTTLKVILDVSRANGHSAAEVTMPRILYERIDDLISEAVMNSALIEISGAGDAAPQH